MTENDAIPSMPRYINKDAIDAAQPLVRSDDQRKIETICQPLHISNNAAHVVEKRILACVEQGLSQEHHEKSSIRCFPTYVQSLPTGKESGAYLAVDLGGTNLRVMLVTLFGSRFEAPEISLQHFQVPENVKKSAGNAVFQYIVNCIAEFLGKEGITKSNLPLGFTFSFPCEQRGLTSAILTRWTKGFDCPDVVGQDVCVMFNKALSERQDISVELKVLINDTAACVVSSVWRRKSCRIGLIVGTGCNACYLEQIENIELWDEAERQRHPFSVINTEWGAFGEYGELDFILTEWDRAVDKASSNPGEHIFEKMTSGLYLGEVVRTILLTLVDKRLAFRSTKVDNLRKNGAFSTTHVCQIEQDPIGEFRRCKLALAEALGHKDQIEEEDCYTVRYVCEEVTRRACMLLGAGIAALARKMDFGELVIGVDGALFRNHPLFYSIMKKKITQLMGADFEFELVQSREGSGFGAALMAAVLANQ